MDDPRFDEHHDSDQLDFEQLMLREPSEGADIARRTSSPDDKSAAYRENLLIARRQLQRFIETHDIGHEFQAIDFTAWLTAQPDQPDDDFDMRSIGGFFLALVNSGIVEDLGYKPNGGNKARNNHSTPRKLYRIASHETTRLGWLEQPASLSKEATGV